MTASGEALIGRTRPSADPHPHRVVIYRLGSLGDTVAALPCLQAVERAYPKSERIVLTNFPVSSKAAPLAAVLEGSGLVQRFMAYPVGTRSVTTLLRLRTELRALGADTLIYLTPSRGLLAAWRDAAFFRLCGFRHIVGLPLTADLQANRPLAGGAVEAECARLARCLAPLGPIDLDDPSAWSLRTTEAERAEARVALAGAHELPRIAINMGGKVVKNDWGAANWCALVTRLRSVCAGHALVFIGADEDAARSARVGALWPGPVVNLCGKVSPRVSAAVMSGSRLFIGHDSGPLHLASCVGVPCVGIYGDNNPPGKWHPRLGHHRIIHDMRGVQAIEVEQVAGEVEAAFATGPSNVVDRTPRSTSAAADERQSR